METTKMDFVIINAFQKIYLCYSILYDRTNNIISVLSVCRKCLICVCLLVAWPSVAGGKITRPWQPPTVYLQHQADRGGYAIIQSPLLLLNAAHILI